jgi:hypothetical protein
MEDRRMKTILVSDDIHRRLKVACATRGVRIQDAVRLALDALLLFWENRATLGEMEDRLEIGESVTEVANDETARNLR